MQNYDQSTLSRWHNIAHSILHSIVRDIAHAIVHNILRDIIHNILHDIVRKNISIKDNLQNA